MPNQNIAIVGKLTLVYLLLNGTFLFAAHFLGWPLLHRWYLSLSVSAASLILVGLLFRELTIRADYTPKNSFLLLSLTLSCCFLTSTLSFLFLHHYLDPAYKNQAANRQVERSYQQVKKIEREKNVTMDFDEQKELKNALRSYQVG